MPIKLLHTSDIHLESKLGFLGGRASGHRVQISDAFKNSIDHAIAQKYNVFLIAGDLFDTPFPSEKTISAVYELFRKISENRIFTAIIAGNHDFLAPGSVYFDPRFTKLDPKYFKIFTSDDSEIWKIPELDLAIHGKSLKSQKDTKSPLVGMKKLPEAKHNIALLHGSVELSKSQSNNPINPQELAKLGFDYTALGDWHSTKQISKTPQAWYSGSPELVNIDQVGAGHVLSVTLDSTVTVEALKVGKYETLKLELDITGAKNLTDITNNFKNLKIPEPQNKFVQLKLIGKKSLDAKFTLEKTRTRLWHQISII
jgi:DNA repair protein SbcD/Mre11